MIIRYLTLEPHMKRMIFVIMATIVSSIIATAQIPNKPWTEWTDKEVDKLLRTSPWSVRQIASLERSPYGVENSAKFSPPLSLQDMRGLDNFQVQSMLATNFQIRFLSASVIRQAFARRVELGLKNGDPRLRSQLEDFVNRKFDEWIVITVDFDMVQGWNPAPIRQIFKEANINSLNKYTYLETDGGRRIPLADYKPPTEDGLGAKFIFQRMENGKPVIPEGTRRLRFYSELARFLVVDSRFNLAEMLYKGQVEY